MEKNIYPYDPDVLDASTKLGKALGTLLIENSLNDMTSEQIRHIAYINNIDVQNLDVRFVYNWMFEAAVAVLRNRVVVAEIEHLINDAKQNMG